MNQPKQDKPQQAVPTDKNKIKPETDKLQNLEQELVKANKQAEDNFKALQRAVADFQNLKKQTAAEKADFIKFAAVNVILDLLSVLDDLDLAIKNTPLEVLKTEWYKGIIMIRQNFWKKLEKQGLKQMVTIGQKFNPASHEALLYQESAEVKPEHIISEIKGGYLLENKVIRPAQVIVSKGK